MNCREFELILPDLVAGDSLDSGSAVKTEAVRHCATCDRCARLLAVSRGEIDLVPEVDAELAIRAVLKRTVETVCASAEGRLPAWADGRLSANDVDLVAGHLAHCPSCRGLAETLAVLREELPAIAEADPGPEFAGSVLALTSRSVDRAPSSTTRPRAVRARRRSRAPALLAEVREVGWAWGRYWAAVMHRPRAALELAYGASLILCLVAGSPATRIREATSEVTALVSRVPSPRVIAASVAPEDGWAGAAGNLRGLIDKAEQRAPRGLLARLVRVWKRAAATASAVRDHGPVMGQAFLRLDLLSVWKEAELIRQAGRSGSEPADPSARPGKDRGMAAPGGAGTVPAAIKGGTS